MTSPLFLLLLLLLSTPHSVLSKHGSGSNGGSSGGGGGGGGGGSTTDGSGSSDGGSGSSSGSGSGPTTEDCDAAIKYQNQYITSPSTGSRYNGTLHVRHTIRATETTSTNSDALCSPEKLGTKVYSYPEAYLFVGPKINENDTNDYFWNLEAYIPFQSWSGYGTAHGAKREIVNLRSQAYTDSRATYTGGVIQKADSQMRVCWDVDMKERTGSGNTTTWDMETRFVRVSEYSGASVEDKYPDRTSNWMTVSDLCNNGFESVLYPDDVKIPKFNGLLTGSAFMQSGANATITNVGGPTVTFKMENGLIDQGIFGAADWDAACDRFGGTQYIDLVAFEPYNTANYGRWHLNLTVEFDLEFEGTLWVEESETFVPNMTNATTGRITPGWNAGMGRRGNLSRALEWIFAWLLAVVLWTAVKPW